MHWTDKFRNNKPNVKVKASELRDGMENWNGTVYFGEGFPRTKNGLTTICYEQDTSDEYPVLDFVTYGENELVEIW